MVHLFFYSLSAAAASIDDDDFSRWVKFDTEASERGARCTIFHKDAIDEWAN